MLDLDLELPGTTPVPAPAPDAREERRARAVRSLGLDTTGTHDRLDRVTRLARTVFGVAISTVTVLEGDRAWFPSAAGCERTPMPRRDTFCDRTTRLDALVIVPDATVDPRFCDLDPVRLAGIRFYAGAPLRDSAGHVLGTLCLFDPQPRTLDDAQVETFLEMAAWAQQELVSSAEMDHARRVQSALLPDQPLVLPDWQVRGVCLSALAVGGDFFDYACSDGSIHLGLGDVMGKGTPAALVGAGVRAAVRATHRAVTSGADLGRVVTGLARSLQPDFDRAESFVTCWTAVLRTEPTEPTGPTGPTEPGAPGEVGQVGEVGDVRWVDAGAGLALLVRADGTAERLAGDDRPIGLLSEDRWVEHRSHVAPGDRLVLVSDGLLDLLDDPCEWWHEVEDLVRRTEDVEGLLVSIAALARQRTPTDDVTVLAAYRAPAP